MYWIRRLINNCRQTASKCTKSHIEFQKFSGGDTPDPVPDWESEKVATLPNAETERVEIMSKTEKLYKNTA